MSQARSVRIITAALGSFWCIASLILPAWSESGGSSSDLQTQLEQAEADFKAGKIDGAVTSATALLNARDGSFLRSDRVARDAQADLAVFQLKAGHPDESQKQIRELLLKLQLELPMDPQYGSNTAEVLARSPQMLKDYFGKVITRLNQSKDTEQIIDSLIDNSVPKDYLNQLKPYCKRVQSAFVPLLAMKEITDGEELKYGDPLSAITADSADRGDARISQSNLEKIGKELSLLSEQGRTMPVADARPILGFYVLALAANTAQHYAQAEKFARQSMAQTNALFDAASVSPDVQLALAYSLLRQDKKTEFNAVKETLLKRSDNSERVLFALARFCEYLPDDASALPIYKSMLAKRAAADNTQKPEWQANYDALVERMK